MRMGWIYKTRKTENEDISIDGYTISKNQYEHNKLHHKNVFFEDYEKLTKNTAT